MVSCVDGRIWKTGVENIIVCGFEASIKFLNIFKPLVVVSSYSKGSRRKKIKKNEQA